MASFRSLLLFSPIALCLASGSLYAEWSSWSIPKPTSPRKVIDIEGAQRTAFDATGSISPTISRWPSAASYASGSWRADMLVFPLPQGTSFQLLIADGSFSDCNIDSATGGGLAILATPTRAVDYGCWWGLSRDIDDSSWVHVRMANGMELTMPLRAFNKRPAANAVVP